MGGEVVGEVVEDEFDESGDELRIGDDDIHRLMTTLQDGGKAFYRRLGNPTLRQRLDAVSARIRGKNLICILQRCLFRPSRTAFFSPPLRFWTDGQAKRTSQVFTNLLLTSI